jgi:hypothetical protein
VQGIFFKQAIDRVAALEISIDFIHGYNKNLIALEQLVGVLSVLITLNYITIFASCYIHRIIFTTVVGSRPRLKSEAAL